MLQTLRRVRTTTLALSTAAFIAISASALAEKLEKPALDVPYVPTPPEVVERMLQMADVRPSDYVIDLGSGDGRIAIAAAKRGARAFGVDLDPLRVQEARENARKEGVGDRVKFNQQNLFDTKIGQATVLTMYLLPTINLQLRQRILEELQPGTRVVSHAFDLGSWRADKQAEVGYRRVYMWVVPAKVAGRWQVDADAGNFSLTLRQTFQRIEGSAQISGREVAVREGRLDGTRIEFTLEDGRVFRGRVDGDRMQSQENGPTKWKAARAS
jgi:SAM-dependent methyltransferase